VVNQRYALIVSVSHDNPSVQLHEKIAQHTQVYQRERTRVQF